MLLRNYSFITLTLAYSAVEEVHGLRNSGSETGLWCSVVSCLGSEGDAGEQEAEVVSAGRGINANC